MERPGAVPQRSHDTVNWVDKSGTAAQQHTQYIRRLADLRDELLNQEETALARALDRLRLHSINNRDASRNRLKFKDHLPHNDATSIKTGMNGSNIYPGQRTLMTTVEKFRQTRPKRSQPVIFPLQGKQLIESPSNGGGTVRPGGDDYPQNEPVSHVEETVRTNLQRLIQPTSSIPNIGRKALRRESLELNTQSLQNMHSKVYKSSRHLVPPFIAQPPMDEDAVACPGYPDRDLNITPRTYKLGLMTEGDHINMDKLNQYYYVCCLPNTPSDSDHRSLAASTPRQGQHHNGLRLADRLRRTSSERAPFPEQTNRVKMAITSDTEIGVPPHMRFRHSLEGSSTDRLALPTIKGQGGSTSADAPPTETPFRVEKKRRQIVIDMPHIIFNAATPDISQGSNPEPKPNPSGTSALSKTLKQKELRQKEVQHLLEDVKELNKRTESLSTRYSLGTSPDGVG